MEQNQEQIVYNSFDYKKYLRSALKFWYLFIFSVGISTGIGYIVGKFIPRQYAATCNIVIGDDSKMLVDGGVGFGNYNFNHINPIHKEIGIIRSKNLAEQTLDELNFQFSYYILVKGRWIKRSRYGNVPFRVSYDSNSIPSYNEYYVQVHNKDTLLIGRNEFNNILKPVVYGTYYTDDFTKFKVNRTLTSGQKDFFGSEYVFKSNQQYQLIGQYVSNLSAFVNPTTQNIVTLTLKGENEERLILYLNTLCRKYIENDIKLRNRMAENTISYIDGQLDIISVQLRESELKVAAFRKKENMYNSDGDNRFQGTMDKVQEKVQENEAEIQNILALNAILDSFSAGERREIIPALFNSEQYAGNNLINQINNLIIQRQYLLANQHLSSPEAIKNSQHIEIQIDLLRNSLRKKLEGDLKERNNLDSELQLLEGSMVEMSSSERQLSKLQREFELAQNIYNTYQQKRIEAVLAKASTVSNIRVLDPARIETVQRIKPNKAQIRKFSLLLGLLLPLAFIVVKESLTDTLTTIKDIKQRIRLPIVGKIFHNRTNNYLVADISPSSAITESFRTLLARLEMINGGLTKKTIMFTSGSSGEGKTFSALNLSILLAKGGKKVLLIGLDLRKPQLHKILQLSNNIGLTNYLSGKIDKDKIILTSHIPNLDFVPSGPIPPNPVELIQGKNLEAFITIQKQVYDHIIIDTPPVGIVADALHINRVTDISLFVLRLNHTRKNVITLLDELGSANTFKGLLLIVNDITVPERYGYYSKSKYGGYYKQDERKNKFKKHTDSE